MKPGESPEEIALELAYYPAHAQRILAALKAFGDRRGEEERAKAWADARKVLAEHDANALADVERLIDRVSALEKQLSEERAKALEEMAQRLEEKAFRQKNEHSCQLVGATYPCAACAGIFAIVTCAEAIRSLAAAPSGDAPPAPRGQGTATAPPAAGHAFLPHPWGKDICDAKVDENDRVRTCTKPRSEHGQ